MGSDVLPAMVQMFFESAKLPFVTLFGPDEESPIVILDFSTDTFVIDVLPT